MTHDSSRIPERKLDLLTGYVEVILLAAVSIGAIAMLLH